MSGTSDSAKKAWETKRKKYGENYASEQASHAGKQSTGGFASEKVGKDGLTGRERARVSGQKGGLNSPTSFDSNRGKETITNYWANKIIGLIRKE